MENIKVYIGGIGNCMEREIADMHDDNRDIW